MSSIESTNMLRYLNILKKQCKDTSKINMTKVFKQFFTPQKYSQIMIENLDINVPKKVLDLSMGEGSLLNEAYNKWSDIKLIGNDIDRKCCEKIKDKFSNITCFNENAFSLKAITKIIKKVGKVDLCLCNPPFFLIPQNEDTNSILQTYQLYSYLKNKYIPAEVIFILQCFSILKRKGTISIILPDGFFVNNYLKRFREFLINNYKIEEIIELPNNIFEKTDAKTHILVIKNIKRKNNEIILKKIGIYEDIKISSKEAINRMDYSFYENIKRYTEYLFLSDLNIKFIRGTPRYLIKNIKNDYIIHTTDVSKNKYFRNKLSTPNKLLLYENKIAKPGDIILARVGTYCIGKVSIVEKGYFIITDCVFIIRVEELAMRNKVYNLLCSEEGQNWIRSVSKGVAAKHITLEDIKKFPYFESKIQLCH